jgi:hypothetical protein
MSYTGNKVFNIFINSANRGVNDKSYDFTIYFDNYDIRVNPNEGVNVNVVSFSLLNSMYNVNEFTENNKFKIREHITQHHHQDTILTIPYGNYSVYSFMDKLNELLLNKISVSYNIATNTYTYKNIGLYDISIMPMECFKLLGLYDTTSISELGTVSKYINMVNYQQVILRCPTLVFENCSMDNIQDTNNFIAMSDFLYWVNKQDVEPFKMINYKNEDCSTAYSYNVLNTNFNLLNFKLVNEYNQPILDAPEFLLQLQISVFDKDNNYFKEAMLQGLNLLNEIYFTLLNIFSFFVKK